MAFSRDAANQKLSPSYRESRDIENIKNQWRRLVREEMSKHLELIKERAKGFSQVRAELLSMLIDYESHEKAERVFGETVDEMLPGARDLVSQIGQLASQWPGQVAPEAVMVCEDGGLRSPTMEVESGPSNHRHGEPSMGPPPRPTALPTPVTPAVPRDNVEEDAHESRPVWEDRDSIRSDSSLASLSMLQTAKRSLDLAEMEHPGSPELPAKRVKNLAAKPLWGLVTKSVDFREVEGKHFIFQDSRYGHGWFALWCDRDQKPPFLVHPLRNNVAINHFESRDNSCHDSERHYELEYILREYTHQAPKVNNSRDELTELMVRSANKKLQRKYSAPKCPARKPRKGKQRAGQARSTASYPRSPSAESLRTYQDDVSFRYLAQAEAILHSDDD